MDKSGEIIESIMVVLCKSWLKCSDNAGAFFRLWHFVNLYVSVLVCVHGLETWLPLDSLFLERGSPDLEAPGIWTWVLTLEWLSTSSAPPGKCLFLGFILQGFVTVWFMFLFICKWLLSAFGFLFQPPEWWSVGLQVWVITLAYSAGSASTLSSWGWRCPDPPASTSQILAL